MRGGENAVSIGDGGRHDVLVAMRRHSNFVEWTPMAVILNGLLEMNKVPTNTIHIFGCILVVARACHAIGMQADGSKAIFRGIGAGGTTLLTAVLSVWAITLY